MKGQAQQIFVYIMVIVIVGLLILFGFKAINSFTKQSCEVREISFIEEFEATAQEHRGYQSMHTTKLRPYCDITEVCFVDSAFLENEAAPNVPNDATDHFVILDSVNNHAKRNLFLVDQKGLVNDRDVYIPNLIVKDKVLCVPVINGYFNVRFIGTGSGTNIETYG